MAETNYISANPTGGKRVMPLVDGDYPMVPGTPVSWDENIDALPPNETTPYPYGNFSGTQGPYDMAIPVEDINTAVHRSLRWAKATYAIDVTITPAAVNTAPGEVTPEAAFTISFSFSPQSQYYGDTPGPDFCDGMGENVIWSETSTLTSQHKLYATYARGLTAGLQADGLYYLESAECQVSMGRYVYVFDISDPGTIDPHIFPSLVRLRIGKFIFADSAGNVITTQDDAFAGANDTDFLAGPSDDGNSFALLPPIADNIWSGGSSANYIYQFNVSISGPDPMDNDSPAIRLRAIPNYDAGSPPGVNDNFAEIYVAADIEVTDYHNPPAIP